MRFLLVTVLCCFCLRFLPAQPRGVEDLLAPAGVLELKESSRESLVSHIGFVYPHPLGWIVSEEWGNGRARVLVFSSEGVFVRQVGGSGEGPGEYVSARSMVVLQNQTVMVANEIPTFVNVYGPNLVFQKRIFLPVVAKQIVPYRDLLVVRSTDARIGEHRVHLFDQNFRHLASFAPAEELSVRFGIEYAGTLAVVGSHIWLADVYEPHVHIFTGWGKRVKTLGTQHEHDSEFIHGAEVGNLSGLSLGQKLKKVMAVSGRSRTECILSLQDQLVLVGPYLNPRADADGVNRKNCWDLYDVQGHLLCPMCPWKAGTPCRKRLQSRKDEVYLVDDRSDALEDAGLSARITRLRLRPDWKGVLAALKE